MSDNTENNDGQTEEPEFSQEDSAEQIQQMEEEFNDRQIEEYIEQKKNELDMGEEDSEAPEVVAEESNESDESDDLDEDEEYWEELANRSFSVGLTEEDIEKLGDVAAIESTIRILEARQDEPETEEPSDSVSFDDLPDEMREHFEKLNSHYQNRIQSLEDQLGNYNQFVDLQSEKAVKSEFDGYVSDLGPDFESLLGSGSTDNLDGDSQELERRVSILEEMNILASGYEAADRAVPEDADLFKKAMNSLYGEQIRGLQTSSREERIAQRRGNFVSRPTQKRGKPMSPEAAAVANVRKYMEESGIGIGGSE